MDQQGSEARLVARRLLDALMEGPLPRDLAVEALPGLSHLSAQDVVEAVDGLVATSLDSGLGLEPVKAGVSRFLHLARGAVEALPPLGYSPLFNFLVEENRQGLSLLEALRRPIATLTGAGALSQPLGEAVLARATDELASALAAFSPFLLHYERLENVLFPWFEAHFPDYRCLTLMWSIHDDVRRAYKELLAALPRPGQTVSANAKKLAAASGRLFFDAHALAFREERLLYPVFLDLLDPDSHLRLYEEARSLGPGPLAAESLRRLEDGATGWAEALERARRGGAGRGAESPRSAPAHGAPAQGLPSGGEALELDAGRLPLTTLDAILKSLRADLTFIGKDNLVAYFSNGPHRVFPRSPAVIGRDVRNCHPHESLGRVLLLIEDLRTGVRERESFWIERGGRFIHIEYCAVRGPEGEFLGVLEASEDLTEKRSLQGEKRLASEL